MRYMNHEIRDYSQWFPGIKNNVADALSREMDLSDDTLTKLLRLSFPKQTPENFIIVPLPNEIFSWLTSLLQQMPVYERFREEHTRTTLGRGFDGSSTASPQDLNMTPTSHPFLVSRKSNLSEPSRLPSETPDFRETLQLPWLLRQSRVPAAFRSKGHPNPTRDNEGLLAFPLSRQYRSYLNCDPKEVQQKAIPLCILSAIALKDSTETQVAT
jgi:hypothetical protein